MVEAHTSHCNPPARKLCGIHVGREWKFSTPFHPRFVPRSAIDPGKVFGGLRGFTKKKGSLPPPHNIDCRVQSSQCHHYMSRARPQAVWSTRRASVSATSTGSSSTVPSGPAPASTQPPPHPPNHRILTLHLLNHDPPQPSPIRPPRPATL